MNGQVDTGAMIKSANEISISDTELADQRNVGPEALVAFVTNETEWDTSIVNATTLRNHVAPLVDWIEIDVGLVAPAERLSWLRSELSNALCRRQMQCSQLVILSAHDTARIALDLILLGALFCAGIVAVDIPSKRPSGPLSATATSIRIVQHDAEHHPTDAGLIAALRQHDADIRLMTLLPAGSEDRNITTRATAAFLSELTSKASRQSSEGIHL